MCVCLKGSNISSSGRKEKRREFFMAQYRMFYKYVAKGRRIFEAWWTQGRIILSIIKYFFFPYTHRLTMFYNWWCKMFYAKKKYYPLPEDSLIHSLIISHSNSPSTAILFSFISLSRFTSSSSSSHVIHSLLFLLKRGKMPKIYTPHFS